VQGDPGGSAKGAVTGVDLVRAVPEIERARLFDEWMRPQRIGDYVVSPLTPTPALVGGWFICRTHGGQGYGRDEIDALRALRPHLLRAVQVRLRLGQTADAARGALAALDLVEQAVVLVDADASVVHANRAADTALACGDGIDTRRSVLACDRADDTAALRRLVGEASHGVNGAAAGGTLTVRRRSAQALRPDGG
ncbi:MAG: hypothetical protein ACJ8H8_07095, partial [Geminicoccaceae bacterium]